MFVVWAVTSRSAENQHGGFRKVRMCLGKCVTGLRDAQPMWTSHCGLEDGCLVTVFYHMFSSTSLYLCKGSFLCLFFKRYVLKCTPHWFVILCTCGGWNCCSLFGSWLQWSPLAGTKKQNDVCLWCNLISALSIKHKAVYHVSTGFFNGFVLKRYIWVN